MAEKLSMKGGEAVTLATATAVWTVYSILISMRPWGQFLLPGPFTLYFIAFVAASVGLLSAFLGVRGYRVLLYSLAGWAIATFVSALLSGVPPSLDLIQTYLNILIRDLLTIVLPSSVTLAAALNILVLKTVKRSRGKTPEKSSNTPEIPEITGSVVPPPAQLSIAEKTPSPPESFKELQELRDDTVDKLLNYLSERGGTITPKRNYHAFSGVGYDVAEEFMLDNGKVEDAVKRLERAGVIEAEKIVFKAFICPDCGSARLFFDIICPTCSSVDIERYESIGCPSCGVYMPESYYGKEEKEGVLHLRCPTCSYIFPKKSGKGSIVFYKCNGCGTLTKNPTLTATCRDCGKTYQAERLSIRKHYTYRLRKGVELGMKDVIFKELEKVLRGEEGLTLKRDSTINGKAGPHVVDIAVSREDRLLASIFLGGGVERTLNEAIMGAAIASMDGLELGSIFVITAEAPEPYLMRIAEMFKIKVLQASSKDAKSLEEVVSHIVQTVKAAASS